MSQRSNIVVVGGGSGALLARNLSQTLDASKYNLILINERQSRIHLIATLRMVVTSEGNIENRAILPYDRIFHNNNGTFKHGTVKGVEKNAGKSGGSVVLESGERIPFQILVLATGSKWTGPVDFPVKSEEIGPFIEKSRRDISEANHITIVGAGAVGLELAGEIKDVYPNKGVTIVHGDSSVLNKVYPSRFRSFAHKSYNARGIKFLYNDRLEDSHIHNGSVTTKNGVKIETNLVISARGATPNTAPFISSLGASVASSAGFIKVTPNLQLPDHPEIFAIGDILDITEQKQIGKAYAHVDVVAKNIPIYLAGLASGAPKKMHVYGGLMSRELIGLTNGKGGGAVYFGVLGGLVFGDWLARILKAKDLFLDKFKGQQGY